MADLVEYLITARVSTTSKLRDQRSRARQQQARQAEALASYESLAQEQSLADALSRKLTRLQSRAPLTAPVSRQ